MKTFVLKRAIMLALVVLTLAPASAFAQRRWHRSRVIIYQPRSYVIYQRPRTQYRTYTYRTYGYPQTYDSRYYSDGYGYTQPYYSSQYYSYRYAQPYNERYIYSGLTPGYRYYGDGYRVRHRRSGIRLRLSF
jgi:hypothetical protein